MVAVPPISHWWKFAGVATVGGCWWALKSTLLRSALYLPSPGSTVGRVIELFLHGGLLTDIGATLFTFAVGYISAIAFGVPLGLVLGSSRKWYAAVGLLIDFGRSVPVTALLPLFILFFGIGRLTIIAMVFVASLVVIILNSAYGAAHVSEARLTLMRSLAARPIQVFREVIVYDALPFVFVGLRISLSFALVVVVVAEMFIGAEHGVGARIYQAHETFLVVDIYALIGVVGCLGYALNRLLAWAERSTVHWGERAVFV